MVQGGDWMMPAQARGRSKEGNEERQGGEYWRRRHGYGQDQPWKTAKKIPPMRKGVSGGYVKEEPQSFGVRVLGSVPTHLLQTWWPVDFRHIKKIIIMPPWSSEKDRRMHESSLTHSKVIVINDALGYVCYGKIKRFPRVSFKDSCSRNTHSQIPNGFSFVAQRTWVF